MLERVGAPHVRQTATASALAVAVAFTASCSLLVDTDGLGGARSEDDAGSIDGAAGASDAAAPDGSTDAGSDADAGAARVDPCTDGPVHCETFDEGAPLSRYEIDDDPETSISIDDALSFSPTRSAKFEIEPSANGSPDATIELTTSPILDVSLEGKVHIERFEPGAVGRLLFIALGDATMYLERSGALVTSGLSSSVGEIPAGRWLTIRVELRRSTSPQTLTVTVEGAGAQRLVVIVPNTPSRLFVRLGISEAPSPTTGWVVRWDDIVIRHLQP